MGFVGIGPVLSLTIPLCGIWIFLEEHLVHEVLDPTSQHPLNHEGYNKALMLTLRSILKP